MAIQESPRPDFGQVKCPDCDALMKPVTLPKSDGDETPISLECPKSTGNDVESFADRRRRMVDEQIAARGVADPAVLDAMRAVPRETFVPASAAEFAYEDSPVPIGEEQTISQPYVVALMAEALELTSRDRVLEIGAGSGYAAAVLSRIAAEVYAIERHASLAELATSRLKDLGYDNVQVVHADGTLGLAAHAPYDAIIVAAGGPSVPEALRSQLAIGGRLVIPVGATQQAQELVRVRRIGEHEYRQEGLGAVRFVPLIGAQGWVGRTRTAGTADTQPFGD